MPPSSSSRGGHAVRPVDPSSDLRTGASHGNDHGIAAAQDAGRSVTEIVDHLFAHFDADGDALITLSEWLGVISEGRADAVAAAMAALDGDADSTMSVDEVTAAVAALDTDADGNLDRAELGTAMNARDADADGMLSGRELRPDLPCTGVADPVIDLVGVLLLQTDLPGA